MIGKQFNQNLLVHVSSNLLLSYYYKIFLSIFFQAPNWYDEIRDDVILECNKHGGVLHVFVDRQSAAGNVYVSVLQSPLPLPLLMRYMAAGLQVSAPPLFQFCFDLPFDLKC